MIIDLKIIFDDGSVLISKDWPDQPIVPLFQTVIDTLFDVASVEVHSIRQVA